MGVNAFVAYEVDLNKKKAGIKSRLFTISFENLTYVTKLKMLTNKLLQLHKLVH